MANGEANFVALARPMRDNPRWGIHAAAAALGADIDYLPQYIRVRPNNWLGFSHVHPEAKPPATKRQLDRPPTWLGIDRDQARASGYSFNASSHLELTAGSMISTTTMAAAARQWRPHFRGDLRTLALT